jgi:excisionase family DNA binding protein
MPVLLDTFIPTERDRQSAAEGSQTLSRYISNGETVRLHAADADTEIALSDSVVRLLHDVMKCFADGESVTVVSRQAEISTIEAADLLGVSRPYLVKLLDSGHIACRRVGEHRRVPLDDLLRYREENKARRMDVLAELQAQAQDLDMGY